jgi:D-alanyl-D-alanine carboxypeptidase
MKPFELKQYTTTLLFVSVLTVFFVAVFFSAVYVLKAGQYSPVGGEKIAEVPAPKTILPNPFQDVALEAQAAYVFDVRTGKVLFARNEEASLPLASLTKVMTAVVASGMPEDTVVAFTGGQKWSLKELLDYMLMVSSNDGASVIAGAGGAFLSSPLRLDETETDDTDIFIKKMNEKAKTLHLAQTFYLNPNGLDVNDTLSGAYGSAKDMAFLFTYVLRVQPALMEATTYDSLHFNSLDGVSHSAENTNIVARTIPGLLASKTGYTDLAGGNLVIAFDAGPAHPIIVAVLGSTQDGRFSDVKKLVDASIKKIGQGK